MTSNAAKFFEDNISRFSPQWYPVEYNLNSGLLALCAELQKQSRDIEDLKQQLAQLARRLPR